MKRLIFSCLLSLVISGLNAQLNDTKWRNVINIPDPNETFLQFGKDTVTVTLVADGTLIETMNFSTNKDTLRITKLFGSSPCDDRSPGIYHFEIKDEKLIIMLIADDCVERAEALKTNEPWTKEKI